MADPESACDAVLKELGVDKLDLLSIEWPVGGADAVRECWSKMEALVDAGKTAGVGLCNASVPMVESVCATCRIKPVVNEVEAHPLMAHRKLVGVCRRYGVVPVANAPLGMGANGSTSSVESIESSPLATHPKMAEAMAVTGEGKPPGQTPEQILARWSVQRGVPLVVDAGATDAVVDAPSRDATTLGCSTRKRRLWTRWSRRRAWVGRGSCRPRPGWTSRSTIRSSAGWRGRGSSWRRPVSSELDRGWCTSVSLCE